VRLWNVAVATACCAGCTSTPPGGDPCSRDAVDCRPPTGFQLDPECSSDEDLVVQLGQGSRSFEPLGAGDVPEVHYGNQGGRHLFVALRVDNPDPDHSHFDVFFQLQEGGDAGSETLAARTVVFSESDAKTTPERALELSGLVLVLPEVPFEGDAALALDARDTCDRRGQAVDRFRWP